VGRTVDLRQSTSDRNIDLRQSTEISSHEKGACVVEHEREIASHEKGACVEQTMKQKFVR
jgi:hypothetical protein